MNFRGIFFIFILIFSNLKSNFVFAQITIDRKVIDIAIIDTDFCIEKINFNNNNNKLNLENNLNILPPISLESDYKSKSCDAINTDLQNLDKSIHGYFVLNYFIQEVFKNSETIFKNYKLRIQPFIIFDTHGVQKEESWIKLNDLLNFKTYSYAILSVGFPSLSSNSKLINVKLNSNIKYFVAAGELLGFFKKVKYLFPQDYQTNYNKIKFNFNLVGVEIFNGNRWVLDPNTRNSKKVSIKVKSDELISAPQVSSSFATPYALVQHLIKKLN